MLEHLPSSSLTSTKRRQIVMKCYTLKLNRYQQTMFLNGCVCVNVVWLWCGCGVDVVWIWCGCGVGVDVVWMLRQ